MVLQRPRQSTRFKQNKRMRFSSPKQPPWLSGSYLKRFQGDTAKRTNNEMTFWPRRYHNSSNHFVLDLLAKNILPKRPPSQGTNE